MGERMKSNKERLYYYMQEVTSKANTDFQGFTTQQLADALNLQRTNLSALLNVLVKENKVDKVNGRPVYYRLVEKTSQHEEKSCFSNLIGHKTTLKNAIQLAKAAILYPEEPLVSLIVGKKGTGKSCFSSLMFEYAKSQNIIHPSAPYVKFNCSYYENHESELIYQLFGKDENDQDCAISRAKDGVIFIDHIECLSARAKNLLFNFIENKSLKSYRPIVICAMNQDGSQLTDEVLLSKFPVVINLPSLEQRQLDERLQFVQKFFTDEAIKMKKDIRINSELLRCFLLYYCEGDIKQLKSDIRIGCANAYVRIFQHKEDTLYVYVYDCPNYVRKGFLFYKDHRDEVEALIPHNYAYTFTKDQVKTSEGFTSDKPSSTLYDTIERKVQELRERGVEEEDISTLINADVEMEISRYTRKLETNEVNKESLAKIVDKQIIDVVDNLIRTASNIFNRVYPSSTFSGLCLYISNMIDHKNKSQQLSNEKIMEIAENHKEEYSLCVQYANGLEQFYEIVIPIDDVVMMTMFLCNNEVESKKRKPVLLIAMHGRVASSIANVINTLVKTSNAYSYDLLLDKDMNEAYEELKQTCKQVDQGAGILLLYDMGSIKKMIDSIVVETGINIQSIELPSTLIALDSILRLSETTDLNNAYQSIVSKKYGFIGSLQENYDRNVKTTSKVIITLCMTGKGTAIQMKHYLENNLVLDSNTTIVALAVSDKDLLIDNINHIMEKSTIQCVIGTYDPKLYGIPFISIASLFETPIEKLPMLLALESDVAVNDIDYDQMYEYFSEQLANVDISKLKRHLRPAVIKIKHLVHDTSPELEVGLFVHIACSIGRMINHEPMPINVKKDQILNKNKSLYNHIKDILAPMEKAMDVSFSDDELAIIIEIIK